MHGKEKKTMNKPNDYDTAQTMGESKKLPPNGYICVIRNAEERKTKKGGDMLVAVLDIYDGEYKDFFMNKYKTKKEYAAPGENVKYPNDGIAYLPVYTSEGKTSRKFKTFCEALQDSGTELQWNENFAKSMVGKLIGVVFGREESEYDGKTWWACKPYTFKSVDDIRDGKFSIPDDKPLSDSYDPQPPNGFSALSDDDVPF